MDLNNKTHYFNRVYVEDVNFKQIYIQDQLAIFFGTDSHIALKHSIYNCKILEGFCLKISK